MARTITIDNSFRIFIESVDLNGETRYLIFRFEKYLSKIFHVIFLVTALAEHVLFDRGCK